jgi:alanine racemase
MNRAEAIIDLKAIDANIKKLLSESKSPGMAVVKADAYGHGLIPVAQQAISSGATWLGTALLEEALALRSHNIQAPILSWLTPIHDDFESALVNQIDLSIPSQDHLDAVMRAAKKLSIVPRIHLEVDTGMSRGGALKEWGSLSKRVKELTDENKVELIGIWSHFARADEPSHPFNEEQRENFNDRVAEAERLGLAPKILHLSNSAATLNDKAAHHSLLRMGIAIYGLSPNVDLMGSSQELDLQPAMKIRAQVHLVKEVPAGASIGYGGSAILERDSKLALIAMGYADGIPRNATSDVGVLIGNQNSPIIGRVSMDQFIVNLGDVSHVHAGNWAYVIGSESGGGYTAEAWAKACGTINYEIVTRIGPRVKRVYPE